jgi:hypothetical protein
MPSERDENEHLAVAEPAAGIHYEVPDDPTLVVEVEFFDLADFAVAASAKFWMSLN